MLTFEKTFTKIFPSVSNENIPILVTCALSNEWWNIQKKLPVRPKTTARRKKRKQEVGSNVLNLFPEVNFLSSLVDINFVKMKIFFQLAT